MLSLFRSNIFQYYNSIIKNEFYSRISFVLFAEISTKIFGYLVLPIYLHLMSKDSFGIFTYIFVLISTSLSITSLGLSSVIIKKVSIYEKKYSEISSILLLQTIFLIFISIIIFSNEVYFVELFNSLLNLKTLNTTFLRLIIIIIIFSTYNLLIYAFLITSKNKFKIFFFIISKFVFINLFSLLFLYIFKDKDASIIRLWGMLTGEFLNFIIFGYLIIKYIKFKIIKNFSSYLYTGGPLVLNGIIYLMINIYFRNSILDNGFINTIADINLTILLLSPIIYLASAIQSAWATDLMQLKDLGSVINKTINYVPKIFLLFISILMVIYFLIVISFNFNLIPTSYENIKIYFFLLSGFILFQSFHHFIDNIFLYSNKTFLSLINRILSLAFFVFFTFFVENSKMICLMLSLSYMIAFLISIYFIFHFYKRK